MDVHDTALRFAQQVGAVTIEISRNDPLQQIECVVGAIDVDRRKGATGEVRLEVRAAVIDRERESEEGVGELLRPVVVETLVLNHEVETVGTDGIPLVLDRGEAGPEEREPAAKARVSSFDEREPLAVPRCQRLAGAHDRDQLPLLRILPALQSIVIDPRAHSIGPALDARVPGLRLLAEDPARMIDGPLAGDHADKLREELFGRLATSLFDHTVKLRPVP